MALDWRPYTEQPDEGDLVLIAVSTDGNRYFESGVFRYCDGKFVSYFDGGELQAEQFFWILEHELMATVPASFDEETQYDNQ